MRCCWFLRRHRIRSRKEHGIGIVIAQWFRMLLFRNGSVMVATSGVVLNVEVLGVTMTDRRRAAMRVIQ